MENANSDLESGGEGVVVVLSTFPSEEVARQIGTALVERQCIACINLIAGVTSIYRWEGRVESAGEVVGIMKTTRGAVERLGEVLRVLHPYECPELLVFETAGGLPGYLGWVVAGVG